MAEDTEGKGCRTVRGGARYWFVLGDFRNPILRLVVCPSHRTGSRNQELENKAGIQ